MVQASIDFNTDKGGSHTATFTLDNPGDDREGGKDYYLFAHGIAGENVSWVEVEHAHVRLQGTDGWLLEHFKVYIKPKYQTVPATGISTIDESPYLWLDNATADGWDYYNTGKVGYGRLNF